MDVIRHVIVRGRVQGVGFRAYVEDEALRRKLRGWVRNRRDGTVEAVFFGLEKTVEEVIAACRKGPPGSRVSGVEVGEAESQQPGQGATFTVLPTA